MSKEYILCAAIWYKELPVVDDDILKQRGMQPCNIDKGIVVCGWRHGNCIAVVKALCGLRSVKISPGGVGETVQGFLTNKNRFVDRKEAMQIAIAAGQVSDIEFNHKHPVLFSEDLY